MCRRVSRPINDVFGLVQPEVRRVWRQKSQCWNSSRVKARKSEQLYAAILNLRSPVLPAPKEVSF